MSSPIRIALVGKPNCGKSSIFNHLTGARQKVANFSGITVDYKSGVYKTKSGISYEIIDLPGAYSLSSHAQDEALTTEVLSGQNLKIPRPDFILCIADANNLRICLRLCLEARELGIAMALFLNMSDLAEKRGIKTDVKALENFLSMPVLLGNSLSNQGLNSLHHFLNNLKLSPAKANIWVRGDEAKIKGFNYLARNITQQVQSRAGLNPHHRHSKALDHILLHPLWGWMILWTVLFLVFQAVFTLAAPLQDAVENFFSMMQSVAEQVISFPSLRDLVSHGVIAGLGAVLVFLPQILLLFLFLFILEDSGYMARLVFLLDRPMSKLGLNGRAFIPILSSYACAVPGIMATRTMSNPKDRLITMMIAPLTTCSARLPVYTLIISATIPQIKLGGFISLQALVMLGLYILGLMVAFVIAYLIKLISRHRGREACLLLEMPPYMLPRIKSLIRNLWDRCWIFLRRAGTLILALSILIWFLSTYSNPEQSYMISIGQVLAPLFKPLGFDAIMTTSLVPAMAAREVAISSLSTLYQVQGGEQALSSIISNLWSLPSALSYLCWFAFAPQCISTLAVIKKESGSYRWMLISFVYMFVLAYLLSLIVYHIAMRIYG